MEPIRVLEGLLCGSGGAVCGLPGGGLHNATVVRMQPLSGGSINRVYRAELSSGVSVVFKYHGDAPPGFFGAEADGLRALREARAIRVPHVIAVGEEGIVLEWFPDASQHGGGSDAGMLLGEGLAKQHRVVWDAYGYPTDNFIGLLPQKNTRTEQWISFYREYRLMPQLQLAEELGRMNTKRRRLVERLMARLGDWIDESAVRPSLLHGDLWAGNWLSTPDGPAVIDPAVYYGDREMDLAMASLFGGFSATFFRAYAEVYPLAPGHEERRSLYQLYYLFIHLNLFGEGYGAQVDRILQRYGG